MDEKIKNDARELFRCRCVNGLNYIIENIGQYNEMQLFEIARAIGIKEKFITDFIKDIS